MQSKIICIISSLLPSRGGQRLLAEVNKMKSKNQTYQVRILPLERSSQSHVPNACLWDSFLQIWSLEIQLQSCCHELTSLIHVRGKCKLCGGNCMKVVARLCPQLAGGRKCQPLRAVFILRRAPFSVAQSAPGKTFASSLGWLIKRGSLSFSLRHQIRESMY